MQKVSQLNMYNTCIRTWHGYSLLHVCCIVLWVPKEISTTIRLQRCYWPGVLSSLQRMSLLYICGGKKCTSAKRIQVALAPRVFCEHFVPECTHRASAPRQVIISAPWSQIEIHLVINFLQSHRPIRGERGAAAAAAAERQPAIKAAHLAACLIVPIIVCWVILNRI